MVVSVGTGVMKENCPEKLTSFTGSKCFKVRTMVKKQRYYWKKRAIEPSKDLVDNLDQTPLPYISK